MNLRAFGAASARNSNILIPETPAASPLVWTGMKIASVRTLSSARCQPAVCGITCDCGTTCCWPSNPGRLPGPHTPRNGEEGTSNCKQLCAIRLAAACHSSRGGWPVACGNRRSTSRHVSATDCLRGLTLPSGAMPRVPQACSHKCLSLMRRQTRACLTKRAAFWPESDSHADLAGLCALASGAMRSGPQRRE